MNDMRSLYRMILDDMLSAQRMNIELGRERITLIERAEHSITATHQVIPLRQWYALQLFSNKSVENTFSENSGVLWFELPHGLIAELRHD